MTEPSALPPTSAVPEQVKIKTKRAPTEYNNFCAETLKTLSGVPPKERLTECGRLWKLRQVESGKVAPATSTSAPVDAKDDASTSAEKVVVASTKAKKEPSEKAKKEPSEKAKKEPSTKAKKEQSVAAH
uniref:HMG box domain-containing protein n=1 Tax=viral metagenome TaxID=1070528 RepID=A0A6C0HPB9_9ZZZZ